MRRPPWQSAGRTSACGTTASPPRWSACNRSTKRGTDMPAITCPVCDGIDLDGVERLPDGRLVVCCLECDHEWVRGESQPAPAPIVAATYESLRSRFPSAQDVSPEVRARVRALAAEFREHTPATDADVA